MIIDRSYRKPTAHHNGQMRSCATHFSAAFSRLEANDFSLGSTTIMRLSIPYEVERLLRV